MKAGQNKKERLANVAFLITSKTTGEAHVVVSDENGNYGLVEIKLGGEELIEKGAATLGRLATKIDTDHFKAPSFKMVVTAVGDCAYVREDGVLVCPIGSLKP